MNENSTTFLGAKKRKPFLNHRRHEQAEEEHRHLQTDNVRENKLSKTDKGKLIV
jgi:hypothetical protein